MARDGCGVDGRNIHQYSIFLKEPENLLFGVWDYLGNEYEDDMKRLWVKAVTKRWLARTDPCQSPRASAVEGEWWGFMGLRPPFGLNER